MFRLIERYRHWRNIRRYIARELESERRDLRGTRSHTAQQLERRRRELRKKLS